VHGCPQAAGEHGAHAFDRDGGDSTLAVDACVQAGIAMLQEQDRQRYRDLAVFPEDTKVPVVVLELLRPGGRADELCETPARLGLVADYRDYLRRLRPPEELAARHSTLVDSAARTPAAPWWMLPESATYLWRHVPYHFAEAGRQRELAELMCDLRWVAAKPP
jgi:hypothetical protein